VVALLAHADDELMCAGTIARLAAAGSDVTLVTCFCSDFAPDGEKEHRRHERRQELRASADALGVELVSLMLEDESTFHWSQPWVQAIEPLVGRPDLLISHRANDANTSHGHLGRVAETIARKNTTTLLEIDQSMPGGLTDHAAPNLFVDISAHVDDKAAAVAAYASQLDKYPGLADAIAQRDRLYGWHIGTDAAEGFTVRKAVML
jgi:LmbE family N-acetylglucosaminyl deacetylase